MIKIGIVGISGYSGLSTLEILLNHPNVRVMYVSANNTRGKLNDIWPRLKSRTKLFCDRYNSEIAIKECDCLFLAVPHTVSMMITPQLIKAGKRVIDLSGDYRLDRVSEFKRWYHSAHQDGRNLKKAVYGLPELYRADIQKAQLIANPGCFPTAAILGLAPVAAMYADQIQSIIIDAKSGVSGAGKKATLGFSYCEVNENFKAYRVLNHQHTPEIDLYLSQLSGTKMTVHFVPHLLPVSRGILETIYVQLSSNISPGKLMTQYKRFYKTEPFVRVMDAGQQVELKNVQNSNYCDISLAFSPDKRLLVITSVIDNLLKGAAGQAVQNMNIMYDIEENTGLK
ncbi:MAG: N-acetyl-gamma-glutamyl-phosphate reductase [Candidatus Omnitrophica bacterium]|nr:N-acetyl-gamma-glutamyl-phosphate reductase [Candidatus Omnitrophota bacterium]